MSIIDIIIIVCAALCIIFGYKKGLLGTAVTLAGTVVPFFLAWFTAAPIAEKLMQTDSISAFANGLIQKKIMVSGGLDPESSFIRTLAELIEKAGLNAQQYLNNFTGALGKTLVTVICFFVILIVCSLIVKVIKRIAVKTNKIPGIGFANRCGGAAVGLCIAAFIAIIIVGAVYYWYYFSGNTEGIESISRGILSGVIIRFVGF